MASPRKTSPAIPETSNDSVGGTAIAGRLAALRERIAEAALGAARRPEEVELVAVSKRQPLELIAAAFAAGQRVFGENRVQEAAGKIPQLPEEAEWHLIGPLQSNKVKTAAGLFAAVHSVDRAKIAVLLDRERRAAPGDDPGSPRLPGNPSTRPEGGTPLGELEGRSPSPIGSPPFPSAERGAGGRGPRAGRLPVLLQVHLGGEDSKHGFDPATLIAEARPLFALQALEIAGLMCIPPYFEDPEAVRPFFRELRELRDQLGSLPEAKDFRGLLSMGMSHDFEVAISEGATHVRVGTALFGDRQS
jgi:uncharacterized pyridoxal phosphate-containing UPF0001 family protein